MLFSDLVGFTAICSTATPMEIISLLQSLYTQFDVLCGDLDIYKVITRAGGFAFSQSVLLSSACHHAINDPILSFCLSVCHRWKPSVTLTVPPAAFTAPAPLTHNKLLGWRFACWKFAVTIRLTTVSPFR
jgi:hypothetical protein